MDFMTGEQKCFDLNQAPERRLNDVQPKLTGIQEIEKLTMAAAEAM